MQNSISTGFFTLRGLTRTNTLLTIRTNRQDTYEERLDRLHKNIQDLKPDEPEQWSLKPRMKIKIKREKLVENSFRSFMKSTKKLKLRPNVIFIGESGIDYGGLTREFFRIILPEIVKPTYALFSVGADTDNYIYHISPLSFLHKNNLDYYRFVGRILGKALFENQLVTIHFDRLIYKRLLNQPFMVSDLEPVDADMYRSLVYIKENDPSDLSLYFTVTVSQLDVVKEIELKPGGKNIGVTNENKKEYIQLMIQHKLTFNILQQMKAMQKGFNDIIPEKLLDGFTIAELELMLCGVDKFDVDDWKANTNYIGGYNTRSPQIICFWNLVEDMSDEDRAKLLQFATGTTRLPHGGFSHLIGSAGLRKFTLCKILNVSLCCIIN
ncbi:MAG: putative E3 ubiquitin-protein ligase Itchy [Streblomastix strix]|uniref:HECT-type E3 ubiquitin transferase n=1 Tax=Streblomastix strix TaxID=222440 RepID=A0A5J4TT84_9EUKA|nr:MAG: putative E3 ubiquitin-protein ligase Itchy [Streblomastix strix]